MTRMFGLPAASRYPLARALAAACALAFVAVTVETNPLAADAQTAGTLTLNCASLKTVPNRTWIEGTGSYSAGAGVSGLKTVVTGAQADSGPSAATGRPASDFFFEFAWASTATKTSMSISYAYKGVRHASNSCTLTGLATGPTYFTPDFVSGSDRYATAVAIAKKAYPERSDAVFVASGENYPDALSAGPAAAHLGAPLLLTPTGSLPAAVASEISSLKPREIYIVGGPAAVSAAVYARLAKLAPTVHRLAGADRYATSRAVVASIFSGSSTAFVTTGTGYADAVSAGAAAASIGAPILLVNGAAPAADGATLRLLKQQATQSAVIIGQNAAVSDGLMSSLRKHVRSVSRIGGADRYETSNAINSRYFGPSVPHTYVTIGTNFPDALSGLTLAAATKSPLMIANPLCIANSEMRTITKWKTTAVTIIGGNAQTRPELDGFRSCLEVEFFNPWDF